MAPPRRAARGADDAHGGRLADAERIADGKDQVAHFQLRGVAERKVGRPEASIFSTAISVRASVPITVALNFFRSCVKTSTSEAPATT